MLDLAVETAGARITNAFQRRSPGVTASDVSNTHLFREFDSYVVLYSVGYSSETETGGGYRVSN